MKRKNEPKFIEAIGWLGPMALISAFVLVSFGIVEAYGFVFQGLNLVGAASLLTFSLYRKFYQSIVLNSFFLIIAIIVIVGLLLGF